MLVRQNSICLDPSHTTSYRCVTCGLAISIQKYGENRQKKHDFKIAYGYWYSTISTTLKRTRVCIMMLFFAIPWWKCCRWFVSHAKQKTCRIPHIYEHPVDLRTYGDNLTLNRYCNFISVRLSFHAKRHSSLYWYSAIPPFHHSTGLSLSRIGSRLHVLSLKKKKFPVSFHVCRSHL